MSETVLTPESLMGVTIALHTVDGTFTGKVIAVAPQSTTLWDEESQELHVVFDSHLIGMTVVEITDEIKGFIHETVKNIETVNGIRLASGTAE